MLERGRWELTHSTGVCDCTGPHLQFVFARHLSASTKAPSQVPRGVLLIRWGLQNVCGLLLDGLMQVGTHCCRGPLHFCEHSAESGRVADQARAGADQVSCMLLAEQDLHCVVQWDAACGSLSLQWADAVCSGQLRW